jgi:hypothetical protein
MSIQTLKKKGVITCRGTNISGKSPGGIWLSQGPFGSKDLVVAGNDNGFSLNGGTRNVGYIGKSSAFSKNGTPFYGVFPIGNGGCCGKYPASQPLMNFPNVRGQTQGKQFMYIKPSVLSTKGMLEKKYRWINSGTYPNYWVQPVYGNTDQSDSASQWLYIQNKAAANICVNDTNKPQTYVGFKRRGGATLCQTTTARFNSYDMMASAGLYTKTLHIPQQSSQYTLQVQRKCAEPKGPIKPFPFAVNSGPGAGGVGSSTVPGSRTNPGPSPIRTPIYLTPPAWYTGGQTIEEYALQEAAAMNATRAANAAKSRFKLI